MPYAPLFAAFPPGYGRPTARRSAARSRPAVRRRVLDPRPAPEFDGGTRSAGPLVELAAGLPVEDQGPSIWPVCAISVLR